MKSPIFHVTLEKHELNGVCYHIAEGSEGIWFPESMLIKLQASDHGTKTEITAQILKLCREPEYTGLAYLSPEIEGTRMMFARIGEDPELKVHVCPRSRGHWVFKQEKRKLEGIFSPACAVSGEKKLNEVQINSVSISPNPIAPHRFLDNRSLRERIGNVFAEGFLGKGRLDRITFFKVHVCLILLVPVFLIWVASRISTGFSSPHAFSYTHWGIFVAYLPIAFVLKFSACARRFHDIGKSAFHCLGLLIPFYNFYLYFLLFFAIGNTQTNQYGAN